MPRRDHPSYVTFEPVDDVYGVWCPGCALPSGTRRLFVAACAGRWSLGSAAVCLDCGAKL